MKDAQIDDVPSSVNSRSASETRALGSSLANCLRPGDVVLLIGTLGAGKSELARGIAEALGATRWRGSPTFNLIHEYRTAPAVSHADLYRLDEDDVEELGLEEYAHENAILIVEWADRAQPYLTTLASQRTIVVALEHSGQDRRLITLHASPARDIARRGDHV